MTREEQIKICRTCKHKKLDLKTGLFCGLTGQNPDFETQCFNLEIDEQEVVRIKQMEQDIKKEDLAKNRTKLGPAFILGGPAGILGAWASYSYVGAICFGLLFCPALWFIIGLHHYIGLAVSLVYLSFLLLIGITAIIAYKKKRDNTVPLGTTFWIIIVLPTVFLILAELITTGRVYSIWFLIFYLFCAGLIIWHLYFKEDTREQFPKSSRKWHILEKVVLAIVSVLFTTLIILVAISN